MITRTFKFVLFFLSYSIAFKSIVRINDLKVLNNKRNVRIDLKAWGSKSYNALMIVPTGIGASIGGYAGDALPSAKLLSNVVNNLITHPNVMNGAMMYWPISNVLYVEGSSLDAFAEGKFALQPLKNKAQRIGLLLDKGIEESLRIRHLNVANAARATLGIDVAHCVITSREVGVELRISSESGASWGCLQDTNTLIEGAQALVDKGCTAIAVVVRFPEDDECSGLFQGSSSHTSLPLFSVDHKAEEENETVATTTANTGERGAILAKSATELYEAYRNGTGVDAIAGAEALISRVISKKLRVPCTHAPAFNAMPPDGSVSPKACAEELGYTFLPCLLAYLHQAPNLIPLSSSSLLSKEEGSSMLTADDIDAVVVPYDALGGAAVLALLSRSIRNSARSNKKPLSSLTSAAALTDTVTEVTETKHMQKQHSLLVIAVKDNTTTMRVTADDLLRQYNKKQNDDDNNSIGEDNHVGSIASSNINENYCSSNARIVVARSYAEAAGLIVAHRAGILLESITPTVNPISITEL